MTNTPVTNPEVDAAIRAYRPRSNPAVWPLVATTVQDLALTAGLTSVTQAREFMLLAGSYFMWLADAGYDTDPASACDARMLGHWLGATGHGIDRFRRRRAKAEFTAILRGGHDLPEIVANPGNRPVRPYSAGELHRFRFWAAAQTGEKATNALALLSLGAGAGLFATELLAADIADLGRMDGGLVLTVQGSRARRVPIRPEWAAAVEDVAARRTDRLFVTEARDRADKVLREFTSRTRGQHPEVRRLRATWLAAAIADGATRDDLRRLAGYAKNLPEHIHAATRAEVAR